MICSVAAISPRWELAPKFAPRRAEHGHPCPVRRGSSWSGDCVPVIFVLRGLRSRLPGGQRKWPVDSHGYRSAPERWEGPKPGRSASRAQIGSKGQQALWPRAEQQHVITVLLAASQPDRRLVDDPELHLEL